MFSAAGKSVNYSGGYTIGNSLRFRSSASAYLSRTPASAGNRQTWTWSGWVKRGAISQTNYRSVFGGGETLITFYDDSTYNSQLIVNLRTAGTNVFLNYAPVFRDASAWYHFVFACDTTQATSSNRFKLYVNGVQITAAGSLGLNYPSQNWNTDINAVASQTIGGGNYFDGYMTEINLVDGQALPPTAFGTFSKENGVWSPITYTGSYGTNGFHLDFSNGTSTTTLGYDSSGNGNNWTTNNISLTAGSTYDWMIDSPTKFPGSSYGVGNYATLNPIDAYSGTMVDGNLYWYGTYGAQNGHGARSTIQVQPTGKWYVEAYNTTVAGSGNSCMLGFTASTQPLYTSAFAAALTPWIGVNASVFGNKIQFYSLGVSGSLADGTVLFASYASGDIVNFAIDFDAGKIWIGKAGTWYNSGNPAAGTNATATFSAGSAAWAFWAEYVAASDNSNRSGAVLNFGQRPFAYTPPSGYKSLCTQNLPGVTIQNGAAYMAATLYTGTGSSVSISNAVNGVGFQPDFVWGKLRTTSSYHRLSDSVRGASLTLATNVTDAEVSGNGLVSFDASGFSMNSSTNINQVYPYVAWQWKAGGTAVTNTAGSITSSVSANQTAGFSVVTYTGNGSSGATVGHGLGVAPAFIIIKDRTAARTGDQWPTYHVSIGATGGLVYLNSSGAGIAASVVWNNTNPSSSVFTLGNWGGINYSGDAFVAYCFAAIPGYSAFGSYTGNGSADGPFVYCGFRPRWLMLKTASGTASWVVRDTSRDLYNPELNALYPNLSDAEFTTSTPYDYLSNGFKLRTATSGLNGSGETIIYAAFAENPFKYSLAR